MPARLLNQSSLSRFHSHRSSAISSRETRNNVNSFTERSHNCGELTQNDIGKRVDLFGWVKYTRFDNKIVALRDSYGTIQCVANLDKLLKSYRKTVIHNESVVRVSGFVQARPDNQINDQMPTGAIEVLIDDLKVLNGASKDLPILTRETDQEHSNVNKMKYRYLDIRSNKMQDALRFRSKVCSVLRQKLLDLDFVECETPTLFRRTPGGANEFIVPTQTSDMFYGLTQSPQQLKQLLMIGGLDRYFQICRCYRDESGRTDRQPEFTQLDIELSFTNQTLIIRMVNQLVHHLLTSLKETTNLDINLSEIFDEHKQINQMDYQEAFMKYGCDKPDTRFGWLIDDLRDRGELSIDVPFIVDREVITRSLEEIISSKKINGFDHVVDLEQDTNNASTRIFINSQSELARQVLGQLRLLVASELNRDGHQVYDSKFKFIWVTGFPLFEYNEETHSLQSNHHPFTAPTDESVHLLNIDPKQVIGNHYDLVLNGQEIAGGSIRIHDADLQRLIFRDILKLDDNTFEYFIEALKAGCPPHGGIAMGLDRLIAILLDRESIRDVIAFPKSNVGRDLMSGCPHTIDLDVKKMYHITR